MLTQSGWNCLCNLVLIKGAGDLASGVAHRFYRAGFKVVMTEQKKPTVVRRTVSFAQAAFEGIMEVEGVSAQRLDNLEKMKEVIAEGHIPLLIDPDLEHLLHINPKVIIEATMAKRNTGVNKSHAPIVIALGPGYKAGEDVHAVIETARGHYLGKVIYSGEALPNTGVPGEVGGYTKERLLRAEANGIFEPRCSIGDSVKAGEVVAFTGEKPVKAKLDGIIRGLLYRGLYVKEGMKIGDVDPRAYKEHCFTISDKARAVAGGALEAVLYFSTGGMNKC